MKVDKRLTKSSKDKLISGVCGGIAEYFGISSLGVRILFLFVPVGIFAYFVLAFAMPFGDLSL